ncbi:hypothetical protein P9112_010968 [Eukaryota sp. TZLM1-RC]
MSVSASQDTESFKIFMQQHDRDAFSIHTTSEEVVETNTDEDSDSRPPSTPLKVNPWNQAQNHLPPLPSSTSQKRFQKQEHPPPSSPKDTNVESSLETSSVLKDYEELQCVLDEIDNEAKEFRQQIMKDAEAHLEPTDYCLFEQLPPPWQQIIKLGRNMGFQTLDHKRGPNRVYEFPQSERKELIIALDALSRDNYGHGAECRPNRHGQRNPCDPG